MLNNRERIKEVFTRYGYIDLDCVAPEQFENKNSEISISMKKHFVKINSTGNEFNGYPEYRITGCYTDVYYIVNKFWCESDNEDTNEFMENFNEI